MLLLDVKHRSKIATTTQVNTAPQILAVLKPVLPSILYYIIFHAEEESFLYTRKY